MSEGLSDETRGPVLEPLFESGWAMVEGRDAITKTFKFADFADAFGWMTRVAIWAENGTTILSGRTLTTRLWSR